MNLSPTLYATVVNLTATHGGHLPATQGRLAQAAFLDIIQSVDPALSAALHVKNRRRPYTVSPLRGLGRADRAGQRRVKPGDNVWLRFTLLGSELFTTFTQFLLMRNEDLRIKNGGRSGPGLRIGEVDFGISEMLTTPGSHDWAGYTDLAALQQQWTSASALPRRITLEFASPTAFSRHSDKNGMGKFMEFFPSPAMLFGSLAARWNELLGPGGPLIFDKKAIRDYAEETVVVGMYKMEARQFRYWGRPQIGAVGRVTYHLRDKRERAMVCLFNLLADFAFYSGVGAKTAMGMGQVRRIGN